LDPPISHWQLLWDILSQLAGKTREVTVLRQPPYLQRQGNRITVNDCPVTLYSTGNMDTQIVFRQWNGQSTPLCKMKLLVHIRQNIAFLSLKYSEGGPGDIQ